MSATTDEARPTIREVEHTLRSIGFSRREAARLIHGGYRYAVGARRRWWQFFNKKDTSK